MMARYGSLVLSAASGLVPAAALAAQAIPGSAVPQQSQAPATPPAAVSPAPVAPVLPPPLWDVRDAQELLGYIKSVGREGLDPKDYDPEGLALAIQRGDRGILSRAATDRFNKLSSHLALGRVPVGDRRPWHITDPDLDPVRQATLLAGALARHQVAATLNGLLPTHPQYGSLRTALAIADPTKVNRIRLNMDRWRWLPRDLGQKYIIVNVPGFHATLVENGVTRWKHRAIAGAVKTPTPQLSALATGVILNPWWEVPKSIEGEVRGKRGYVPVKGKDGKGQRWRQPPGPANALGKVKFVMPNSEAIYLHDTNARSRFSSRMRALSHGCVRTEHILDLTAELLSDDGGEWTKEKIDEVLASNKTVEAKFVKPVPVYIVYFSSAALVDGQLVDYPDLYNRDPKVLAALLDRKPVVPTTAKKEVASK